jgi:hypothetical protein
MRKICEVQAEIEIARMELDEAILQKAEFACYYEKSRKLDKLIEEYLEEKELHSRMEHEKK